MTTLVVIAWLAGQRVAFDAAQIEGALDLRDIVPVPLAPPHVLGLAAVRSQVMTVLDTIAAAGQPGTVAGRRALVVLCDGHRYALLVDAVEEVLPPTAVHPRIDPSIGAGWARVATATVEVAGDYALLLDVPALISGPQQRLAA